MTLAPFLESQSVCRISLEPVAGFSLNLHRCTTRTSLRAGEIEGTLNIFSGSQEDLNIWKFH